MKRTLVALAAAAALVSLGAFANPPAEKAAEKAAHGKSCCASRGTAAATSAAKGEHCPAAKGADKAACAGATKTAVALTGTVLCEHCDLHQAPSCNPVFKAEGREGYLSICPETSDVAGLKSAGDGGKSTLTVKGNICKMKDGKEMLQVESFAKKA